MSFEELSTARLILRRPRRSDAEEIFARYASDAEVTRLVSFPRHRSIDDTFAYIAWSDAEWARWPAGPYVIRSRADGKLLGGTGYAFESPQIAVTGYVLARDAWRQGYATEALQAIVEHAPPLGVRALRAFCHVENHASAHVLEKCGFRCDGVQSERAAFPNAEARAQADVLRYSIDLARP